MKKLNIISVGCLALCLASPVVLSSCASSPQQESTGQYIDSSTLTMKVKAKLLADNQIKSLPIKVNTYKNTVQLSGFVNNSYQKERAAEIARSVPGVTAITNSLIVKPR